MSLNASQDGDVCSFCLDTFDNPRTLEWQVNCVQIMFSFFLNHFFPSSHDFCLECAKLIIKQKTNSTYYINCPLCEVYFK